MATVRVSFLLGGERFHGRLNRSSVLSDVPAKARRVNRAGPGYKVIRLRRLSRLQIEALQSSYPRPKSLDLPKRVVAVLPRWKLARVSNSFAARHSNARTPAETKIRELSGRKSPQKRAIRRRAGNVRFAGIEPVTPSMSTRCLKPNTLRLFVFLKAFVAFFAVCSRRIVAVRCRDRHLFFSSG